MSAKSFYYENKQSEESDDRSSVSSIPWNSDAIKQNQMNWEHVERMLHFEEALPDDLEPELRQEILDWQTKFPQLAKTLKRKQWTTAQNINFNLNNSSTNVSEILDFSSSLDDDDDIDEVEQNFNAEFLEPPKPAPARDRFRYVTKRVTANAAGAFELADVFGKDLHITPLTLRQRRSARLLEQRKSSTTSTQSDSPVPAKTIKYKNLQTEPFSLAAANNNGEFKTKSRYHMPPILNVLETKRRFCALNNSNRSFVQLTQIQQAKSAAVHSTARQTEPERRYHVWNKPLAPVAVNSRFLNNRNAIVLPALRQQHSTTTNLTDVGTVGVANRQLNSFSNSNSSLSSGDVRGRQRMHLMHNTGRQTTTTTSSGRSISAVPMHLHGAFYNF